MSTLYTQTHLGALTLQNHLVMAPMTRCRALDNIPNALMAEYYAQRGSAGLIITEGVSHHRMGWVTPAYRGCSLRPRSKAGT